MSREIFGVLSVKPYCGTSVCPLRENMFQLSLITTAQPANCPIGVLVMLKRSQNPRPPQQAKFPHAQFISALAGCSLMLGACARGNSDSLKPESSLTPGRPYAWNGNTATSKGYGLGRVESSPVSNPTSGSRDTVYFSSDSSELTPDSRATLQDQLAWLRAHPSRTLTIEGHADERGTREYNIALGARRADAVRSYLAANGMNPQLVRTLSYGKERPVAVCDDISCWSKNRRAQVVMSQ